MQNRGKILIAGAFVAAGVLTGGLDAQALTMKECSAKYNAAKAADKLGGKSWNEFRKAECSEASAAAPATPASPQASAPAGRSQSGTTTTGNVVFPRAINTKYASETAAKQRQKTCLDQYNENKEKGGNGDLKWIQKGGGYYSQCNARLKGQTGA